VRSVRVIVTVATVLWILTTTTWSLVVPIGNAPDELLHLDMVTALREGPGNPRFDDRYLSGRWNVVGSLSGRYEPSTQTHLAAEDAVPRPDRPTLSDLAPEGETEFANQMTQHPPGYYGLMATAVTAAAFVVPADWWSWDRLSSSTGS